MKILFVTEAFPYPLDSGGNVRSFNLLKGLAREHDVTLVSASRVPICADYLQEVGKYCRAIHVVKASIQTPMRDAVRYVSSLLGPVPFVLKRHVNAALHDEIRRQLHISPDYDVARAAPNDRFDAVHFNHLDAALYASCVPPGTTQILDQHNVVSNQMRTSIAVETNPFRRILMSLDLRKLERFEPRLCNGMSATFVCSDADRLALQELGATGPIEVVPNGVDLDYFSVADLPTAIPPQIVFFGTLDYPPCDAAVRYCLAEILPLILAQAPDVQFYAVGRNPSTRLQSIAAESNSFFLTGRIEDIRPVVQRARVSIVPLLSGSGTRLKILEAMAMGVPVVSTSIGAEGLGAINQRHLWIADSAKDFADAVLWLLKSEAKSIEIRSNARRFVEEHFGWNAIWNRALRVYRQLEPQRK